MQQQMKIIGSECYYLSWIAARLIGPAHLCQNPSVTLIISTTPAPEASPQKILLYEELENYNSKKVEENETGLGLIPRSTVPGISGKYLHKPKENLTK